LWGRGDSGSRRDDSGVGVDVGISFLWVERRCEMVSVNAAVGEGPAGEEGVVVEL
jgi:hypothetical protein